jgi:PGF-CTERM protein
MSRLSVGLITTVLVISVLAPAAVGGATAQEDQVVVTVSLVDSNGDSLGSGVNFTVSWDGGSTNATTLSNGKEYIEVPNGSDIEVQVDDNEYIRNRPYVKANVVEETVEVPVAQSGQATITVERTNGNPVADAEVRVREGSTIETLTTDANGQVTTSRLEQRPASQPYELVVEKSGYLDLDTTLTLTETVNETVTLTSATRTLNVQVVDNNFDPARPIEDARVRIPDLGSLQTSDNGRTDFPVRVNSDYNVQVNKDGYSSAGKRVEVAEEDKEVTVGITRADELTVEATNNRVVVGETTRIRVYDEYNEPVSNAQVTIGGTNIGLTGQSGELDVPIDSAGNVTIEVSDAGETATVTVEGVDVGSGATPTPTPDDSTPTPVESTPTPTVDEPTPTADESTPTADESTPDDDTTDDDTTAGSNGPGFGVVATIVALVGALFVARRR